MTRPASGPGVTRSGPAQPSFQPVGSRGSGRQPDRPDWAERTERIDRVGANGYPDSRVTGRVEVSTGANPALPAGPTGPARGRGDSPDRRMPDPREISRAGGGWGGTDDDPLTSKAYSRSALADTDGRSYRAARRSQVPPERRDAALTEQTQTFSVPGHYQSDSHAPTAQYPAYGGQQTGPQPVQQPRQSSQPGQPGQSQRPQLPPSDGPGGGVSATPGGGSRKPYDRGATASYPYPSQPYPSCPAGQDGDRSGRHHRPSGYGSGGYSTGTSSAGTSSTGTSSAGTSSAGTYGTGSYGTGGYGTGGYSTEDYSTGEYGTGDYGTSGYGKNGGYDSASAYNGGSYSTGGYSANGSGSGGHDSGGAYGSSGYDNSGAYSTGGYDRTAGPSGTDGYGNTGSTPGYGTNGGRGTSGREREENGRPSYHPADGYSGTGGDRGSRR